MPAGYKSSIKMTGPFFQGDPGKKFKDNVREFMGALAAEGEKDVRGQLASGEGGRASLRLGLGRVSQHVVGRTKALTGKQWKATAVVSVNNTGLAKGQAIRLMAAASLLESRGHAFRKTRGRLTRASAANIDMLKGLR